MTDPSQNGMGNCVIFNILVEVSAGPGVLCRICCSCEHYTNFNIIQRQVIKLYVVLSTDILHGHFTVTKDLTHVRVQPKKHHRHRDATSIAVSVFTISKGVLPPCKTKNCCVVCGEQRERLPPKYATRPPSVNVHGVPPPAP